MDRPHPYPVPPKDGTGYYLDADDKTSPNGVVSLLDTDWYKLTMMQAIVEFYPEAVVQYRFKTRNPKRDVFTREAFEDLVAKVEAMEHVTLTDEEEQWLLATTPYLKPDFVSGYLKGYRFRPKEQVRLSLTPEGIIEVEITGLWRETILYEVPLLYLISETFFEHIETDWSYFHPADQSQLARSKIQELFAHNVYFSDFGTRRRRSYRAQETFIRELSRAHFAELDKPGTAMSHASGTSNVHFARLYGLRPIGTVAHEWTMAVSALEPDTGLEHANYKALIKWAEMYAAPEFRIALSDTFGVDAFLRDFDAALATEYRGTRQDSGDPKVYVDKMVEHYRQLGIDYSDKFIVFSDALNVPRCIALKDYAIAKGIQARFGVGTNFTNDYSFHGDARASPTLNIVIKLHAVARKGGDPFIPVVKLSDEKDKYTGEKAAVKEALAIFGIKNGSE